MKLLFLFLPLCAAAVEPLPLSKSYWQDEAFQKSFNGTYRIEARIEPVVSTEERGLLVEIQALMEKGQRKEALAKVKASPLTPKSAALQFNLGNLHFEEGELEEAVEAYREALELYPSFRRAHRNLAMALVRLDQLEDALPPLLEAVKLGDVDGATYGLLGYCRLQQGEWASALQAYRMAQLSEPDVAEWKAGVAQCLQNLEAREEAAALLDEVVQARPEEASYALLLASVRMELGAMEKAVAALELPRRLGRLDADGLLLLGDLHLREGRVDDAKAIIAEAFAGETKPSLDRVLISLESAMARKAWDVAADLAARARPEEGDAPRPLRRAEARLKIASRSAPAEGAKELEALLKEDPTDGTALMALGKFLVGETRLEEAELRFERATAVESTAVEAWVELARVRVAQERYRAALEAVGEALARQPSDELEAYRSGLARLVEASE